MEMTQEIRMKWRLPILVTFVLASAGFFAEGQSFDYPHLHLEDEGIEAPSCMDVPKLIINGGVQCTQQEIDQWLRKMHAWRAMRRIRMGYDTNLYGLPQLKWTQSSFIQPQMMMEDRYFYDPVAHKYTVDRYLDDLTKRYGGIDSVLIWHTYTNIGIDNRNQYDLLRDMPGGLDGVREMVADFHRHGVKVFFPVMVWDQGTRDEGKPNWDATAELMKAVDADGVNGDTMDGIPEAFAKAAEKAGHPLVLEPEHFPAHDEMLAWNTMTWGYWTFPYNPLVSRSKWLEPRSMVNICARWTHAKTDLFQSAFLNGTGFESWENVWGIWNGITVRDGEAIRRFATIERGVAPYLVSDDWQPYYPTLSRGLFSSRFPLNGDSVWTLVNRADFEMDGPELRIHDSPAGAHFYDLYHGVALQPRMEGADAILSFNVEANGYGAILMTSQPAGSDIQQLMEKMRVMTQKPLASYSSEWTFLPQQMTPIKATAHPKGNPEGMVHIPAGEYRFRVQGVEIEGHDDVGVDVQYPWETSPRRYHDHVLQIHSFWLDKYPVTNAEFKKFMDATHYHPVDAAGFLKDWKDSAYPAGWQDKPVTWVSMEDARAYAAWAGKRLPHEWEWQYAAQGNDGRLYPWGNDWDSADVPVPETGRTLRGPDDVSAHPKDLSPFGIYDMVGNVWQWTDEFDDEHTRAGILRGGSYYQPKGSIWYFPQAFRNDQHGKFLLMAPSEDRSATVGFRCVVDTE
jgi:gamma-glutamyl hercynylcysteine S-oxide synthase